MRSFIAVVQGLGCLESGCAYSLCSFNLVSGGLLRSVCDSQGYQTVTFSLECRILHQIISIIHLLGVLVLYKSSKTLLCVSLEV